MSQSVDRFLSGIEKRVQSKYIPLIKEAILGDDAELQELLRQIPGSPVSVYFTFHFPTLFIVT